MILVQDDRDQADMHRWKHHREGALARKGSLELRYYVQFVSLKHDMTGVLSFIHFVEKLGIIKKHLGIEREKKNAHE